MIRVNRLSHSHRSIAYSTGAKKNPRPPRVRFGRSNSREMLPLASPKTETDTRRPQYRPDPKRRRLGHDTAAGHVAGVGNNMLTGQRELPSGDVVGDPTVLLNYGADVSDVVVPIRMGPRVARRPLNRRRTRVGALRDQAEADRSPRTVADVRAVRMLELTGETYGINTLNDIGDQTDVGQVQKAPNCVNPKITLVWLGSPKSSPSSVNENADSDSTSGENWTPAQAREPPNSTANSSQQTPQRVNGLIGLPSQDLVPAFRLIMLMPVE